MCWHRNLFFRCYCILRPPQACHSLPLRVEINTTLAVEIACATTGYRLLVSGEAEHWQWDWNRDINALLAGLDLFLEARCGCTGAGKNRCAVAIGVGVDERDSFVDGGDVEADKDRAKDFFSVAFHMRLHVCDHGRADLVSQQLGVELL